MTDHVKKMLADATNVGESFKAANEIAIILLTAMGSLAETKQGAVVAFIPDNELPKSSIEIRLHPNVAHCLKMLLGKGATS